MSGGHWEYLQYRLEDVSNDMLKLVEVNGGQKSAEELREDSKWYGSDYYEKFPEEKYNYKYPDEVIEEFKKGAKIIQEAQVYMQRFDWLLSGDDGEESFLSRLKEDLNKLNK